MPTMKIQNTALILILVLAINLTGCTLQLGQTQKINTSTNSIYIENKGSDTMVNLALAWAEEYQSTNPKVSISLTGGGTGTGIAALIDRNVDIANASREIKAEEREAANQNNVHPLEHIVARDAIAIIVNPSNPINYLTLQQLSNIYSGRINNWSEVGGTNLPIVRLSRETNSGTHQYFLERVLRLGEKGNSTLFSKDTLLIPSSQGITAEVSENPNAIGYDGLGYITPEVKMIAVSVNAETPYVLPSVESVDNNSYPIARNLFMYTDGLPSTEVIDYIRWIKSTEGQQVVVRLGFIPIMTP